LGLGVIGSKAGPEEIKIKSKSILPVRLSIHLFLQYLIAKLPTRYRLHLRENECKTLFLSQCLFQQYLVDAWSVCAQNKLSWIRTLQTHLRADLYNGLADSLLAEDFNAREVGRRITSPSSYTGGDRYMQQLYHDSMAIVRHFGHPTLFITFTANPKWKAMVDELRPGQTAIDRPDLVARVFYIK